MEWGPLGLFVAGFLGATLVPLSSEAVFVAGLSAGIPIGEALLAASLGNGLACAVNWGLGRWARDRIGPRLQASRSGRAALDGLERWGAWSLALSWLPIVGDPITLAAGMARVSLVLFVPVVFTLRVARYVALAGLA